MEVKRILGSAENDGLKLREPTEKQELYVDSPVKRIIVRAGRRGGKTVGAAIRAVRRFLKGRRVLYAAPTTEQINTFWGEVTKALAEPIAAERYYKNETEHVIEMPGTPQRIKAKTAWNADTLRGDYCDELILDEWQLMNEDAWGNVGAPMLLDNDGNALFIYTPPSLHSRSVTKASDPMHAAKMFAKAEQEKSGRWLALHFTSHDNPHISKRALSEITQDMTQVAYRQEILAEDLQETPGAFWTRAILEQCRVVRHPDLLRIGVGVDPPGGATECGIVAAGIGQCSCKGKAEIHGFVIEDRSLKGSPEKWGREAVTCYYETRADRIFAEKNYGGDMVLSTIQTVDPKVACMLVQATRGKAIRAEPIAALYEQGRIHHVGLLASLEEEMVTWTPGLTGWSPNHVDALVWVLSELMLRDTGMRLSEIQQPSEGRPITGGIMTEII